MRIARLIAVLSFVPAALAAQAGRFPPDTLRNIKVLPNTMSVRDVIGVMRGFTSALGVRCPFCHVGQEGQDLSTFNFASDDKPNKETARIMLRMVQAINTQHLSQIAQREQPSVEVNCTTCHRGAPVPRPLNDIIANAALNAGADSAVRAYRALRERYYGRSAYDFGEFTLIQAVAPLQQSRKFDEALALLRLNAEFYPQSSQTMTTTGEVYRMRGDTAAAITAYRQALQMNQNDGGARQRLRELGQTP
jgi:tetratricopeptide (TPR) repeat protein